jgi:toxin ParE1/3/4
MQHAARWTDLRACRTKGTFSRPELQDLRRWPVHDFENWLVFYRSTDDAIDVLRILHGARDFESLFDTLK